ncbi:hypothetical protein C8R26_1681 [Nitrosomonas oligotropha]|uniref:Uncharacterized protein n=1 Tax=Nitrosomonas oligotropha TaxID=42354 RepID=A0A2T5GXR0_9PROT|nr:hypothetical protein [Nitrosomonas oligotropha]PTQ64126.1 hypothetical protein C8R26_1681 [Nitrosomonas oligotropha]
MSGYLSRLKQIENEKNFHNSPESELTKPPKGASVSFVSSVSEENKKNSDIQLLQIEMVRAWLCRINELVEDHNLVLNKCRNDPEALEYFLKHAKEVN